MEHAIHHVEEWQGGEREDLNAKKSRDDAPFRATWLTRAPPGRAAGRSRSAGGGDGEDGQIQRGAGGGRSLSFPRDENKVRLFELPAN